MSRLRNRNIRMKIQNVSKWGQHTEHNNHEDNTTNHQQQLQHDVITTTADSGIAMFTPLPISQERHQFASNSEAPLLQARQSRSTQWNVDVDELDNASLGAKNNDHDDSSSSDASSVDTLCVLKDIRILEDDRQDSIKTNSAESYNSWDEIYESNSAELVRAEYDRMVRVLQCKEAIPPNYDRDEYRLWIKTFPCLSLVHRSQLDEPSRRLPTSTTTGSAKRAPQSSPYVQTTSERRAGHGHTTFSSSRELAANRTINPSVLPSHLNRSFLQLAPVRSVKRSDMREFSSQMYRNRTIDWLKDVRHNGRSTWGSCEQSSSCSYRRNSEPPKRIITSKSGRSSSDFIVLPPIETVELRSVSAAAMAVAATGEGKKLPTYRMPHRVHPLYETETEHEVDDFHGVRAEKKDDPSRMSYGRRKRKLK